ncbi:MAG: fibronectin type III domain-containing protein, partial [Gammaproteobacteria bacterium]|nr:fibronectin type III domain-containing protein [Gammaproteobacteria bacterium]
MKLSSLLPSLRANLARVFAAAILFSVASSASAQIVLTLTPTDTTKVYGDAEPQTWYTDKGVRMTADGFGFTLTGNFADGDDEAAVLRTADRHRILVREAGDDVGSYAFSLASDFTGWTALGGSTPVPNIQRGVIKGKFFRDAFATTPKYRVVLAQNAAFTITKKEVTYTSTAADKVYDGTTAAPASLGGSFAADDLEDGDTVTATGGTYASDQVGEGIAITGFAVSGDDAANYSLASGSSVAGDITAKSLTLSGVKLTKAEGGGTATTGATVAATINGLVSGHTGTLALVSSPTAVFASGAAGDGITITGLTAAQLVLTVVDSGNNPVAASNYQLPGGNIAATGQITSVAITPPDAPGAPTLTPNFRSIEVSWTAPADNGNAITDNRVRWRTAAASGNPAGDWNGAGNNGVLTGTDTNYTITGLTNGTQYDVQVAAVNGGGAGNFSPSASAAPVANIATLASLVLTDPDGGAVTLSPAFAAGTTEYAVTVDATDASVTVTATATDAADATIVMTRETGGVTGSAQTLTGGTASSPQALVHLGPDAGDQQTVILEITVTAGDGSTTERYEIVVRRPNGTPGAPATPTAATGTAAGSLDIGWSAPSATGGLAITGYRVRWGKDATSVAWNASGDGILAGNQSVTSYTITGLETGTAYQVQVAAVNSEGTGAWSDSVTITPQAASVDADITALAVNEADGTTPVTFSPAFSAATTSYAATVDNDVTGVIFIATYAGSKLVIDGDADNDPDSGSASEVIALTVGVAKDITLVVTAADDSTTKTYTVTVTRAAGAPVKPAKPTSARSTAASRSIAVSWAWAGGAANNGSPVTEFNVQWKKTGDTNWLPDANGQVISDASDRSYAVTGLDAGARYHARVRAVNAAGDGAWSDNSDAARASGPPSAPLGVLLSQIVGGITVNVQSFGSPDNGGSDIVAHHVRWRTAAQGGNPAGEWQNSAGDSEDGQRFTASAFGGSHNINGLIGGTRYEVQARWQNGFSDNNLGPWSRSFFQSPSRMSLSLTPKAATKVYGEADPALDYDAVRFVNLDTKANVFASVPFERVAGETVGEYNYRLKDPIPWATAGNPAGRYTLSTTLGGSAKFTITAKEITYTSTAADKTYDGNVNAPSDLGGSFSAGVVNTSVNGVTIDDTATGKLSVTGGRFGDKTAGDNKAVTQFVLDGDSKDNYTLASGSSVTGDIAKLATTLTLNVNSRVYDGTTNTGAVTPVFSPEIISGDTVTVDVSGAVYADANAGTGKTINGVADAQITGGDKANYEITIESAGEVTKRPLRVSAGGSGNARPQTAALGDRSLLTIASGVSGEGLVSPDTAATVLSGSIALGDESGSAPR